MVGQDDLAPQAGGKEAKTIHGSDLRAKQVLVYLGFSGKVV
jgi:hypothetical protein